MGSVHYPPEPEMSKKSPSFAEARDAFVKALTDYQTATRDLSLALSRVSAENIHLHRSLRTVLDRSGSMIAPRS